MRLSVCIVSLMRIIYLANYEGVDEIYESARLVILTVMECGLSIVTACLPIIRVLFQNSRPEESHPTFLSRIFTPNKSAVRDGSNSRTTRKNCRKPWTAQTPQDESQVDIVRSDDDHPTTKSPQSKDEEMNWDVIEMTVPDRGQPAKSREA